MCTYMRYLCIHICFGFMIFVRGLYMDVRQLPELKIRGISSIRSQNINLRHRNMADLRLIKLRLQIGIFDTNRKSSIQRFAEFNLPLSKYQKEIMFCIIFS